MIFQYNGVNLQMVSLDRVLREPVYDPSNTDLLYIKWTIAATCIYSPGGWPHATALVGGPDKQEPGLPQGPTYNLVSPAGVPGNIKTERSTLGNEPVMATGTQPTMPNDPGDTSRPTGGSDTGAPPTGQFPLSRGPVAGSQQLPPGSPPVEQETRAYMTDTELRTRLWLPRRQLRIGWPKDDNPVGPAGWWLVAPAANRLVDPANGPFPVAVDVVDMGGEGVTFGVSIQIVAHTPATPEDVLVLSHRWEMTHVHDDSGYLTRIIDGIIIFNGAEVNASGVQPDWLRNQFFMPIPLGFRRYLDPVTASPDGLTIRYRIRDVDQTVVFDPGDSGATQMDIQETVEYIVPWGAVALAGVARELGRGVDVKDLIKRFR